MQKRGQSPTAERAEHPACHLADRADRPGGRLEHDLMPCLGGLARTSLAREPAVALIDHSPDPLLRRREYLEPGTQGPP